METIGEGGVRLIGLPLPCEYESLAEAGNGYLYAVPREGGGRVLEIDPSTGMMREIGDAIAGPLDAEALYTPPVVAPNGNLYAAPASAARVLEINPYTGVVQTIGPDFGAITRPSHFHYHRIALGGHGCLYAAPYGEGHVLKIDTMSGQVSTIGEKIEGAQVQYSGIAVGSNGHLYASPMGATHVLQIDSESDEVRRIGEPIQAAMAGKYWENLARGRNGKLYSPPHRASHVLEVDAGTVRLIGPDLTQYGSFTSLEQCREGKLWALSSDDVQNAVVIEVDTQDSTVTVHRMCDLMQGSFSVDAEYCVWAAAGNGRLYAAPRGDSHVLEFDPKHRVAREIGEPIAGSYWQPYAASNGRVFMLPDEEHQHVLQVDYHTLPRQDSKTLSSKWQSALTSGVLSDITVKTSQGKTYQAHKVLLALRSRVFRSMFASNMRESNDSLVELGDVSPSVSDMFMKYLYAESAETYRLTIQEACELASLAHKYEIEDLGSGCAKFLQGSMSVSNAARLLRFADRLQMVDLKQACLDFVVANPDVVDTNEWEEVPSPLLREVAAAWAGKRSKKRRLSDWEFPAGTDWNTLTVPKLRRACAERCLAQEGDQASLIERLQA